jgi:hypothetical protein
LKRFLIVGIIVLSRSFAFAQIGGVNSYDFLSLSPSARTTGLGGINVTLIDHDLSTQLSNPASLNPLMNREVSFGTTIYPGSINFGNAQYAQTFNKIPGTFGFGIQYIDYGQFTAADADANITGKFTAGEMNAYAGYGYQFGRLFSVGANAKLVYSQLAYWNSEGVAADIGAMINDTAHVITFSIVAKNIGSEIKPYNPNVYEPIPFDLQAGLAFGFKHLPIKFHITFHHLYEWNIRYDNPADDAASELFTDSSSSKPNQHIADMIFEHIIFGAEINIKKVVRLEVAYNQMRQEELSLTTKLGLPGISFGVGIHIKQFDFSYAFQPMAQGQTLNYFTLSVNTSQFRKRRVVHREKS